MTNLESVARKVVNRRICFLLFQVMDQRVVRTTANNYQVAQLVAS